MKSLFLRYQEPLLKLANHSLGRKYLGVDPKKEIVGILPNAFAVRNGNKITAEFRGYDLFEKRLGLALRGYDSLLEGIKYYFQPQEIRWLELALTSPATLYSGAGDGHIGNSDATYSTCHDAATGNSVDYTSTTCILQQDVDADGTDTVFRTAFPIDTSGLGSKATVAAAIFSAYVNAVAQDDGVNTMSLVQTNQASNTVLATADFDEIGKSLAEDWSSAFETDIIEGATAIAVPAGAGYVDWTLDATGRGWISTSSYTKLGVRLSDDMTRTFAVQNTSEASLTFRTSEYAATTSDPKIVITYTVPSGFLAFL